MVYSLCSGFSLNPSSIGAMVRMASLTGVELLLLGDRVALVVVVRVICRSCVTDKVDVTLRHGRRFALRVGGSVGEGGKGDVGNESGTI